MSGMVTTEKSVERQRLCVITRSSLPYCRHIMMPLVAMGMALSTTATLATKRSTPIRRSTTPTTNGNTMRRSRLMA